MKKLIRRSLAISATVLLLAAPAFAQNSADAQVEPERAGKVNQLFEQIQEWGAQIHEVRENRKLEAARREAEASVPPNETRKFEVVTKGGTIPEGGTFVRLQPHVEGSKINAAGEIVSKPFDIGGGIVLPGTTLTPAQKKEMKRKAERLKQDEEALKAAEEAQRKAKEANLAAEKARQDAEAQKQAADEAVRIAEAKRQAQLQAERAAREASRAEANAIRDGARIQQRIASERARFRAEGGPFRAPASGGGGGH